VWWLLKGGELSLCCSYWALLLKYKDPGIIEINPEKDYQILSSKDLKKTGLILNICAPCQQRRPLRSKHVRQTEDCVARFDHYCEWVANAIGEKNHKAFMAFLISVNWHCLCYAWLSYYALPTSLEANWYDRIYEMATTEGILLFTFAEAVTFVFMMGIQLIQQVMLMTNNLTMNEAINLPRYRYFWNQNNEFVNPFDRGGRLANLKDFLFPSTDWYNVYYVRDLPSLGEPGKERGNV